MLTLLRGLPGSLRNKTSWQLGRYQSARATLALLSVPRGLYKKTLTGMQTLSLAFDVACGA